MTTAIIDPEVDELVINLYCTGGLRCDNWPICNHKPNWAQEEFTRAIYEEKYDAILALGGFRSGKTSETIRIAIDLCLKYPGNRVLLTRKYTVDVQATLAPDVDDIIPEHLIVKKPTAKDPYYTLRTSGDQTSQLWVVGLYGTDRKRIGKLKGAQFGAILVSQSEEISYDDFLFLKSRLSMTDVAYRPTILEANPPNIGHWLHTYFEVEKNKPGRIMFSLPTEANADNIPKDYIEKLREEYRDRPGWLKCYLEGTWGYTVLGDAAFAGLKEETHILKVEYNTSRILYRSWDFGWHHPAVGWYQGREGADGGLHKFKEDLGSKVDIRKYARHIIQITNEAFPGAAVTDFGDYAGNQHSDKDSEGRSNIQILKDEFDISIKTRPNPAIDARVSLIQKYISMLMRDNKPGFTVDPSCRITIDGLQGGYSRDKEDGDIIKDGFFEHIMDTDGYAFWNLFQSESSGALQKARLMKIRNATYNFGARVVH